MRYCRHKEGLASLKKKYTTYNGKVQILLYPSKSSTDQFQISVLSSLVLRLQRSSVPEGQYLDPFSPNMNKQQNHAKLYYFIFLLQTVTVISNGRIEQITRYNCVFTHILIIVFCAYFPREKSTFVFLFNNVQLSKISFADINVIDYFHFAGKNGQKKCQFLRQHLHSGLPPIGPLNREGYIYADEHRGREGGWTSVA